MYFRAASVLICTQSKNYFLKLFFLVRANVYLYSLLEGE